MPRVWAPLAGGFAAFFAVLSAAPAQGKEAQVKMKVKTSQELQLFEETGVLWPWKFDCVPTGFTPQAPPPIVSPLFSDPGKTVNPVSAVAGCFLRPSQTPGSTQQGLAFNVSFPSLHDLGTWAITCNGFWAHPSFCVSDPNFPPCSISCLESAVQPWPETFTFFI